MPPTISDQVGGAETGAAAGPGRGILAEHLSWRRQILIAAYWFSLSFHGGALFPVAVAAQLLGLSPLGSQTVILAVLGTLSGLIVTVVQPLAGVCSDLTPSQWGRRRPYVLGGALLDVIGLALMAWTHSLPGLFGGFLLASIGSGVSGAAYQAYIPDQVPASQYGEASGYMGAMTMLGTIASFAVAGLVVSPDNTSPFYLVTILIITGGATITALCLPDVPLLPAARPTHPSWRALWLDPWRNPDFSWVFATRAMLMLALYTLFTFVAYYVRDVVHVTQFAAGAAAVAGVATLAALVGGIITGLLSDRLGRKVMVSVASVLMSSALFALAFLHQLSTVLGLGVIFGLALGTYTAVDWALAVDVLPSEGFAAKDLGLWGISTNLPQMAAPLIGGAVLLWSAPLGEATGYGLLFGGAAFCAAVSGVLVWQIRGVQ
jgi:MFS family permease